MTCIIGYLDRLAQVGYIAGDSSRCNFETGHQDIVFHSKVFISVSHPDILIGATTSFRHIDLLKYYDIFEGLESSENLDHWFMVKNVVPRVHDLFGNCWTGESNNGANVIIVTPHALFEIQPDYSVISPSTNYTAVGIGAPYAMASLHTSDIHPRIDRLSYNEYLDKHSQRIEEDIAVAMQCAERYVVGVHGPFCMLQTNGHHKILE